MHFVAAGAFAGPYPLTANEKAARTPAVPDGVRLLGSLCLLGWRRLNCVKVEVEQRIARVTLVLVLLPEPDDLLQDLDVEALALGLGKNVLLLVVHRFEVLVDTLDALDERAKPIARHPIWSTHALLLSASKHLSEKSRPRLPLNEALLELGPDTQRCPGVTLGRSG